MLTIASKLCELAAIEICTILVMDGKETKS